MGLDKPARGRPDYERMYPLRLDTRGAKDRAVVAYIQQLPRRERQSKVIALLYAAITQERGGSPPPAPLVAPADDAEDTTPDETFRF